MKIVGIVAAKDNHGQLRCRVDPVDERRELVDGVQVEQVDRSVGEGDPSVRRGNLVDQTHSPAIYS
jgi:hypothetical protein